MIKKLNIIKFRSLENVKYDDFGLVNEINGSNGVGKTTVIDSILWMLADYTIVFKYNNDSNVDTFNPYKLVNVILQIDDCELERKYGYIKDEETGDVSFTNAFYYNGRRCKSKTEYTELVKKLFNFKTTSKNIDLLVALMIPTTLCEGVTQKDLRELIESLLSINFNEKLLENNEYKVLQSDLMSQDFDEEKLQEYYKQRTSTLNKEKLAIDLKLEGQSTETFNEEKYNKVVQDLATLRASYKTPVNTQYNELSSELHKTNIEYAESYKQDVNAFNNDEEIALRKQINSETSKLNELRAKYSSVVNSDSKIAVELERLNSVIELSKSEIETLKSKTFEKKCPKCGYVLNESEVESKTLSNEKKIEELKAKIEKCTTEIKDNEEKHEEFNELIFELTAKGKEQSTLVANLNERLQKVSNTKVSAKISQKTLDLESKINDLKAKMNESENAFKTYRENYNATYYAQENALKTQVSNLELAKQRNAVLQVSIDRKKEILKERSTIETKNCILKQFIISKINLVATSCHNIFGNDVAFTMLEQRKTTDGFKKVCYPTYKGKDYFSWNTAERMEISIIIINKLKEYLQVKNMPVIFDVSDNIGDELMEHILSESSSQTFFTSVNKQSNIERKLIVRK